MELSFSQIIEVLVFLSAIAGLWVQVQIKIKEIETKILVIEKYINSMSRESEKEADKIFAKLESILESISDLKIQLNNKADKL